MGNIITADSYAAGVGVGIENKAFALAIENRPQKILIVGAALAAKAGTYVANTPRRMYSGDEAGGRYGLGGSLDITLRACWAVHKGAVETYVAPQAESGTGVAATVGGIEFTNAVTTNGYMYIYVAGTLYKIWATTDDTISELGDLLVAALAADPHCPVTGVNTAGDVVFTCKEKGTWGNDISISFNEKGEDTPAGLAYTITPLSTGANDPSIADVLAVMGADDNANADAYTIIVPTYDKLGDTTMDALSEYNGTGNEIEGCYAETVRRPFVALYGDNDEGTDAKAALVVIGTARRALDRTNGVVPVPCSPNHPSAIAGAAAGLIAKTAHIRPNEDYYDKVLTGILPGLRATIAASTGRWTDNYVNRKAAVEAGVGTTVIEENVVKLQNMLTFYHPESVAMASNGYRAIRDIMISMSVIKAHYDIFNTEEWDGISIVADVAKVGNATAKAKVRDWRSVFGTLCQLADEFENRGWIYESAWTKETIAADIDTYISLREGGTGWDTILPLVYSGKGGILNATVQFDVNLAVITG